MPCPGSHLQSPLSSSRCTDCHAPPQCRARLILLILFPLQTFDANDLYQGQNFNKVLSSLVTLNKITADIGLGSDFMCAWPSSYQIKSSDSLGPQPSW